MQRRGIVTSFQAQLADEYESRIRWLEEVVCILLARVDPPSSVLKSSPPLVGSFRYSIKRGLEPVLSRPTNSNNPSSRGSSLAISASSGPSSSSLASPPSPPESTTLTLTRAFSTSPAIAAKSPLAHRHHFPTQSLPFSSPTSADALPELNELPPRSTPASLPPNSPDSFYHLKKDHPSTTPPTTSLLHRPANNLAGPPNTSFHHRRPANNLAGPFTTSLHYQQPHHTASINSLPPETSNIDRSKFSESSKSPTATPSPDEQPTVPVLAEPVTAPVSAKGSPTEEAKTKATAPPTEAPSATTDPFSSKQLILQLVTAHENSIQMIQAHREATAVNQQTTEDRIACLELAMRKLVLKYNPTSTPIPLSSTLLADPTPPLPDTACHFEIASVGGIEILDNADSNSMDARLAAEDYYKEQVEAQRYFNDIQEDLHQANVDETAIKKKKKKKKKTPDPPSLPDNPVLFYV